MEKTFRAWVVVHLLLLAAALAVMVVGISRAWADTADPGVTLTAAEVATVVATAAPAEPGELLGGGVKVLDDWTTAGWMAGLVALCNLLMTVLKRVPFVSNLFKKAPPWVQPVVVLGVGAVGGFFSGFMTGGLSGGLIGVVAGIGAGSSAIGLDTAAKRATAAGAAEVAIVREVKASLAATDDAAAKKTAAMTAATESARKIANPGARMKAFAALLKNGAK